jgi:hypothetical protein
MPQTIDERMKAKKAPRKVHGIAAALLPYKEDGSIAVEAFQQHLIATHRAGLMNAVNMDTGYVNFLSATEKQSVLRWTREALGSNVPFIAGAFIENEAGDPVHLYRQEIDAIANLGGTPILFQTARLHGKSAAEKASTYQPFAAIIRRSWRSNSVRDLHPMVKFSMPKHSGACSTFPRSRV